MHGPKAAVVDIPAVSCIALLARLEEPRGAGAGKLFFLSNHQDFAGSIGGGGGGGGAVKKQKLHHI